MTVRVSVVVPFLDAEAFLAETIESVLAQDFGDWELILVDDGGKDGSRSIARSYAGRHPARIRLLEHPGRVNLGVCASRNLAVREARGEYVALLDADDVWFSEKLREQVAILDARPSVGMVYGHSTYWRSWTGDPNDRDADHTPPLGVELDRVYEPPELALRLYPLGTAAAPCPSDLLLRRDLVLRVGGFEERFHHEYQLYEDQAFLSKIYVSAAVYVSSRTWDRYRIHAASCDARVIQSGRYHEIRRFFLEWLEAYYRSEHVDNRELRRALWRSLFPYRHPVLTRIRSSWAPARSEARATAGQEPHRGFFSSLRPARLGSLRRIEPISRRFGYDRGLPIDRFYIERFLNRNRLAIRGRALEVGDDSYTKRFGGDRVERRDVLHVTAGTPGATIIADLAAGGGIPSDAFDCFILTQTLQLVWDLRAAIATVHRVLAPGGVVLATFPGLTPIVDLPYGNWYWGLTRASAAKLFGDVFGPENVEVESHGNVLASVGFLHGLAAEELAEAELERQDLSYQLLITVRAVKPPSIEEPGQTAPLVSIVIPCYNHARYLPEAIETSLAQTHPNVEVVVVDDGSTDASSEVAAKYPRVRLIRQENRGLAAARNTGIENSRGEYLLFLDADDRLLPDALEESVKAARGHPESAFVFGRFHVMNASGARLLTPDPPRLEKSAYAELLQRNWIIMHGTVLYRRQTFEEIGPFDASLLASEDYDMYMRVARQLPIAGHGAFVAEVRKHRSGMTRNYPRMLRFTLAALRRQWRYVRGRRDLRSEYRKGEGFWKEWYGRKLVTETKVARFEKRRRDLLSGLLALVRYYPRGLREVLVAARRSNSLEFLVDEERAAPAPGGPVSGRSGLHLRRLGNSWTKPRDAFNRQPNGESALWLECDGARPETVIVFGGVPLDTIFGGPRLLTALVPAELYEKPGRLSVYLVD